MCTSRKEDRDKGHRGSGKEWELTNSTERQTMWATGK